VFQLQGVITIDPDGKYVRGRWYGMGMFPLLGFLNRPDADASAPHFFLYPSGYPVPYSFSHPVTGK
jgi:hypothetical protein